MKKKGGKRMYKNFNVDDKVIVKGKITEVFPTKGSHDVICVVKLEDGDMIRKDQTYLYPYGAVEITQKNDEMVTPSDNINHPAHYTAGKVECIDALEAATTGLNGIEAVCTANAIKYLWRWKHKNGVEDLRKAQWYIGKLIEVCAEQEND